MAISGCCKGQVCKCEKHTALDMAACIQMTWLYAYLRPGIALSYFYYLYPILPRELVVQKEVFQGLGIHIYFFILQS